MTSLMSTGKEDDGAEALAAAMKALSSIYEKDGAKPKPRKKRPKKEKVQKTTVDQKTGEEKHVEIEEFVNDWKTCACGMNHPPVPDFRPPRGKMCTYYWQIAERFPYITLHRVLSTEMGFKKADTDGSGLIETAELKGLLKKTIGGVTDRMVERTFKCVDTDESGSIDFIECLEGRIWRVCTFAQAHLSLRTGTDISCAGSNNNLCTVYKNSECCCEAAPATTGIQRVKKCSQCVVIKIPQ